MRGLLFVATPKSIVTRKDNNICIYNENGQFTFPIGSIEHVFLLGGITTSTIKIKTKTLQQIKKHLIFLNFSCRIKSIFLWGAA